MASLPIPTREVPPDLKCSICWDIAIDPVVPAITSTDEKIEKVCKHFFCKTCEHIAKEFALEHREIDEIDCPQCLKNYSSVLPDECTAEKVKNFIYENPYTFDNKSYDELVEERRASIPIAIQIMDAIKNEKLDKIKKIAAEIENPKEKSKILFEIATKQLKNENIEATKFLVKLIPNENYQIPLIAFIIKLIFEKDSFKEIKLPIEEIEKLIETLPNNSLKAAALGSLITITQKFLSEESSTLTKEYLIQKILQLIDWENSISPSIEPVANFTTLLLKINLYSSIENLKMAKELFSELKKQMKDIPDGFEKSFILSSGVKLLSLFNKDLALELLEEIENLISKLKLRSELKDAIINILFAISLKVETLEKMEAFAREFSENGSSLENIKKAILDNTDMSAFLKEPSKGKTDLDSPLVDNLLKLNITSTPPRIFVLSGVATIFINNDKIEDGLRIFNEINQTDDTSSITFQDKTISELKGDIRQIAESLYKNMFYLKNTSICEKIIEYQLINEEDVKRLQMEAIEENTPAEEEELSVRRRKNLCNKIFSVFLYPIAVTVTSVLIKRMYFDK